MLELTGSTTDYFALKARDAAGNWSAISNGPPVTDHGHGPDAAGPHQVLPVVPESRHAVDRRASQTPMSVSMGVDMITLEFQGVIPTLERH